MPFLPPNQQRQSTEGLNLYGQVQKYQAIALLFIKKHTHGHQSDTQQLVKQAQARSSAVVHCTHREIHENHSNTLTTKQRHYEVANFQQSPIAKDLTRKTALDRGSRSDRPCYHAHTWRIRRWPQHASPRRGGWWRHKGNLLLRPSINSHRTLQ